MIRTYSLAVLIIIFIGFTSCKNESDKRSFNAEETAKASAEFNQFLDHEFERDVLESPMLQAQLGRKTNYGKWDDFSHLKYAKDLEKIKERRNYLNDKVDEKSLDPQTLLSYRLYKQELENKIEDYEYRFYNYPINQISGYHVDLPAFLINIHRIETPEDAHAYIARLKAFPAVFDDVIKGIKLREQNRILPPKFVYEKVIESSHNIIKGKPFSNSVETSPLLADFKLKIEALELSPAEEQELIHEAEDALLSFVKPAYEKLIAKMEDQLQRATTDYGAWKFPKGEEYYNKRLRRITTLDLNANEIHQIGLSEVARIQGEMEKIKEQVGFEGSLQDFFEFMRTDLQFYYPNTPEGKEQYLTKTQAVLKEMEGGPESLFDYIPNADLIVKAVESFREKSGEKSFYQRPAIDGTRPGIYYINLYDLNVMPVYQIEAMAYHNGVPGHHLQASIAQEQDDLPMFRKFKNYDTYVEGWGLYSTLLPKETGLYQDVYSDFGRLALELWRSCHLVVDTGIHAKKWTREQGIAYYKENTPSAETDWAKIVEHHIVMPGQALAYKIGMNKIVELREEAKAWMGEEFDLKEFHQVVLKNGAVPLNVLEDLVQDWANTNRKREN